MQIAKKDTDYPKEMTIKQTLLDCGINVFAIDLLCESYLKSPVVDVLVKPLAFEYRINRSDCDKWAGVKITLEAIPREEI